MKALRLMDWKTEPKLVDVHKPTPGPGEVVVKIGGAGACHSDLHVMHDFEPGMMPWKVPFTLGHENAGWVDSVGDGVTAVAEGDAVAVYGAWGCGKCSRCQQGYENYCENPAEAPAVNGGHGWPGGWCPRATLHCPAGHNHRRKIGRAHNDVVSAPWQRDYANQLKLSTHPPPGTNSREVCRG